jgi:hypothetical protein
LTVWPLIALALLAGSATVEIENQDGSRVTGELIRLDLEAVELAGTPKNHLLPMQALHQIRLVGDAEPSGGSAATVWIELTDGSRLQASGYGLSQQRASIRTLTGSSLSVDSRLVRLVRYSAPQADLDRQWDEILQAKVAGDVLIVRRPNQILDYVVGQLGEIDEERIQFQFDGKWIDVRPEKVDGIIPFQPNVPPFPAPKCRLRTRTGDSWQLQNFVLDGEQLRVTSNNGAEATIPVSQIDSLSFGSSAVTYLSDIEPERMEWTPFLRIDVLQAEMSELFRPRRDQNLAGGTLRIVDSQGREQTFSKGLSIHSRTEIVYRLAGEYRQFAAQAGLAPSEGGPGSVALVISVDGTERWRQEIIGDSAPASIDLDVTGANWLTILVDYGEQGDVGDHLNLCDARLVK